MSFRKLPLILVTLLFCFATYAQVGINTTTPDSSAILDIASNSQGVLLPRVSLTGQDDLSTIEVTPGETLPADGLLVFNISDSGTGNNTVRPGYYYFSKDKWVRLHNQGYDLQLEQSAEVQASNNPNTYTKLPGLDTGVIKFPFAGIYKISGTAYYSAGPQSGTGDGTGIASLALEMIVNGTSSIVKERFVSAVSLDLGTTIRFDSLGQQVSYSFLFEANTEDEYRFAVKGREWDSINTSSNGTFGKDTASLTRSNGENDAYRGSLIISLSQQF